MALEADSGPVTSTLLALNHNIPGICLLHVFKPLMVLYSPLPWYPWATIGGIWQQALLAPDMAEEQWIGRTQKNGLKVGRAVMGAKDLRRGVARSCLYLISECIVSMAEERRTVFN